MVDNHVISYVDIQHKNWQIHALLAASKPKLMFLINALIVKFYSK
jgi:hypothetical protein